MKFDITNRFTGKVQFTAEIDCAEDTPTSFKIGLAMQWAYKTGANMKGANMEGANMEGANMEGANMEGAYMEGANMEGANMKGANMEGAYMEGANMEGANMKGANMEGAYSNGKDWIMPDGIKFSQYLAEVVPALLTAGGKTMQQILASKCWDCHSWDNCPMHVAHGIKSTSDGPALLRGRIREFVQLFDAGMIPEPMLAVTDKEGESDAKD